MDTRKIEEGVRLILEGVGEDPDREGLRETPARVARMYEEVFAGLAQDPAVHFEKTFNEHCNEMVLVRDISFYSMCEHHLVPFFGKAHIGYIPAADGRVCGLSKLARLVEVFAKRPHVHEHARREEAGQPHGHERSARRVRGIDARLARFPQRGHVAYPSRRSLGAAHVVAGGRIG